MFRSTYFPTHVHSSCGQLMYVHVHDTTPPHDVPPGPHDAPFGIATEFCSRDYAQSIGGTSGDGSTDSCVWRICEAVRGASGEGSHNVGACDGDSNRDAVHVHAEHRQQYSPTTRTTTLAHQADQAEVDPGNDDAAIATKTPPPPPRVYYAGERVRLVGASYYGSVGKLPPLPFFTYVSRLGQDQWVLEQISHSKVGGYFVDVGSPSGRSFIDNGMGASGHSGGERLPDINAERGRNTRVMESTFGWRGICAWDLGLDRGAAGNAGTRRSRSSGELAGGDGIRSCRRRSTIDVSRHRHLCRAVRSVATRSRASCAAALPPEGGEEATNGGRRVGAACDDRTSTGKTNNSIANNQNHASETAGQEHEDTAAAAATATAAGVAAAIVADRIGDRVLLEMLLQGAAPFYVDYLSIGGGWLKHVDALTRRCASGGFGDGDGDRGGGEDSGEDAGEGRRGDEARGAVPGHMSVLDMYSFDGITLSRDADPGDYWHERLVAAGYTVSVSIGGERWYKGPHVPS